MRNKSRTIMLELVPGLFISAEDLSIVPRYPGYWLGWTNLETTGENPGELVSLNQREGLGEYSGWIGVQNKKSWDR